MASPRAVQEILQPLAGIIFKAVFLDFSFVSAQSQGRCEHCSFAKASLKPKNPCFQWPQYFLKRSKSRSEKSDFHQEPGAGDSMICHQRLKRPSYEFNRDFATLGISNFWRGGGG